MIKNFGRLALFVGGLMGGVGSAFSLICNGNAYTFSLVIFSIAVPDSVSIKIFEKKKKTKSISCKLEPIRPIVIGAWICSEGLSLLYCS